MIEERFTYETGKYYDKGVELTPKDICNLLNDNTNEIDRLLSVIQDLHTDIRNLKRQKKKIEQINLNLNEIIENYQLIYLTLKGDN